jgi:polyisoprenoid-binding protein YceI
MELPMPLRSLFATLGLALALPALAAPEVFAIDTEHTYPRFAYEHLGLSTQISRFNQTSGTVTLDLEARRAEVAVTIDMRSVDTGSTAFDKTIQEADLLDTARFPTATYRSTEVVFDGDRPARIEGLLTLRGVTRPVTLTVTSFKRIYHPLAKKDAIGANATGSLKRSEFGAGKFVPLVGDEVTLSIALEAIKQ